MTNDMEKKQVRRMGHAGWGVIREALADEVSFRRRSEGGARLSHGIPWVCAG